MSDECGMWRHLRLPFEREPRILGLQGADIRARHTRAHVHLVTVCVQGGEEGGGECFGGSEIVCGEEGGGVR